MVDYRRNHPIISKTVNTILERAGVPFAAFAIARRGDKLSLVIASPIPASVPRNAAT
jgi:hypothetical protein